MVMAFRTGSVYVDYEKVFKRSPNAAITIETSSNRIEENITKKNTAGFHFVVF